MLFSRWTSFAGFCFCLLVLGIAAYLQVHIGLQPCPLCVLQRLLFVVIGFIFLVSSLYMPLTRLWRRIHALLITLFSAAGLLVAGRHVWLVWHPPANGVTCSPTLDYMLRNLPLRQTWDILLRGSGDCARQTWQLFHLTIPEWTFLLFALLTLFGIVQFFGAYSERSR